jgi:hypothetical protein
MVVDFINCTFSFQPIRYKDVDIQHYVLTLNIYCLHFHNVMGKGLSTSAYNSICGKQHNLSQLYTFDVYLSNGVHICIGRYNRFKKEMGYK